MSVLRCAIALAASAAVVLVSARVASCDEGPANRTPGASDKLAWDEPPVAGLRMAGAPQFADDYPPPGPPRDGDRDRPPPRDRNGRGDADRQPPPRLLERDGRPGPDGQRPPGPPRDGDHVLVGTIAPAGRPGPDWPREALEMLKKSDPEMYKVVQEDMELDHQTRELAMRCRQAPKEQGTDMKKQLQEMVNMQFDVRQERRNLELKRLDAEIQRLRDTIDRRSKARDKIVEQRVLDLLGVEGELSF
jgi:uncharacterized protein YdcH (DUF465 family)